MTIRSFPLDKTLHLGPQENLLYLQFCRNKLGTNFDKAYTKKKDRTYTILEHTQGSDMPPKKNVILLGLPLFKNSNIYQRINENFNQVIELMIRVPMQNTNCTMFGSFWIYIARLVVFSTNSNGDAQDFVYVNDDVLKFFLTHMLSH